MTLKPSDVRCNRFRSIEGDRLSVIVQVEEEEYSPVDTVSRVLDSQRSTVAPPRVNCRSRVGWLIAGRGFRRPPANSDF